MHSTPVYPGTRRVVADRPSSPRGPAFTTSPRPSLGKADRHKGLLFTPAPTLTSMKLDQKRNTFEQDDEGKPFPTTNGPDSRPLPYRTLARQDTGLGVRPRSGRGRAGQKHEMTGQEKGNLCLADHLEPKPNPRGDLVE